MKNPYLGIRLKAIKLLTPIVMIAALASGPWALAQEPTSNQSIVNLQKRLLSQRKAEARLSKSERRSVREHTLHLVTGLITSLESSGVSFSNTRVPHSGGVGATFISKTEKYGTKIGDFDGNKVVAWSMYPTYEWLVLGFKPKGGSDVAVGVILENAGDPSSCTVSFSYFVLDEDDAAPMGCSVYVAGKDDQAVRARLMKAITRSLRGGNSP